MIAAAAPSLPSAPSVRPPGTKHHLAHQGGWQQTPIARPPYVRTFDEVVSALHGLAREYPQLARVTDYGDSAGKLAGTTDNDLLALTLGNAATGDLAAKPTIVHLGGVHARETANPELLVRWAQSLLETYGRDPKATRLLDERQIVIVPIANPDGHEEVERGYANGDGRAHRRTSMSGGPAGVDLNRNFDMNWGAVPGGEDPYGENYQGVAPASEPEVASLQTFVRKLNPRMLLDWHSRGEVVLSPFGNTPSVDDALAGVHALGERLAKINGYAAMSSYDFSASSGTAKDWAFGALGIPAFTVETGVDHHQDPAQFATTVERNFPVLDAASELVGTLPEASARR